MSIAFLIVCGLILTLVIVGISSPFWRKDQTGSLLVPQKAEQDQEIADLTVEREVLLQSLQELEVELAQGRLESHDYERLKATDERRLLQVIDRLECLQADLSSPVDSGFVPAGSASRWVAAFVPSVLVLAVSIGIYGYIQWRTIENLVELQSQMGVDAPDPREMVARLEERLRQDPNNLQGQIMAGRSYMAMQRIDDAKKAWTKVLELDPRNHEAHFHLGVIMLETRKFDDPELFQEALGHFDKVLVDMPNQPGVNWYRGVVLWYLDRHRETEEAWATAFKNMDPSSKDADFVKTALAKLREGETPF